jgi:DNA-binding transcriptional LysR family regulator
MKEIDVRGFEQWARNVLPELATYHAACTYKNRTKAATKLGKDPSSVSKALTRLQELLEEYLGGGSLIDRGEPRKVCPTEAGEELLRYAEEVRAARTRLLERLNYLQRGAEIRLAMTHYAWLAYDRVLETAYMQRRLDGELNFGDKFYSQDRVWEDIEREVLEGNADVGVYSFPPSRARQVSPDLAITDWMKEEIVLVLPASAMRLPSHTVVPADLPIGERVVHYRRALEFDRTDAIEAYLKKADRLKTYSGDWLLGVNTIAEMKETLLEKGGMSFLPWPAVEREHKAGILRAYKLAEPMRPRTIKMICRLHTSRKAVADFIQAAGTLAGERNFYPDQPRQQESYEKTSAVNRGQ